MFRAALLVLIVVSLGYQHGSCCPAPAEDLDHLPPLTHSHGEGDEHGHDEGDCPHTHHICVGTHVFFTCHSGGHVTMAALSMALDIPCLDVPLLAPSHSLSFHDSANVDNAPPAPTLPVRAELQVYLI